MTPGDLALEYAGDELALLLVGAPLQDRGTDQGVTEEVGAHGRPGLGELFIQDHLLQQRQSLAAVFDGPPSTDPATGEELLVPILIEHATFLGAHREIGVEPAVGQILL